ncbi:MAG: sortase [Anaerolineae bacterium]|nr:sortase [Anaerolineae bacterium]
MYQRGGSSVSLITVILLGVIVGVAYLIYDNLSQPQQALPIPTLAPEPQATAVSLLPAATATLAQEITAGAQLIAPTAGINTRVIQSYISGNSWDVSDLGIYAGHLQGTSWVDHPGNVVLAGHVEMADGGRGVFADIGTLNVGDPLILRQNGSEYVYTVSELLSVKPDDLSVVYPSTTSRLTLITCSNYSFLQDIYQDRFVVIAEKTS